MLDTIKPYAYAAAVIALGALYAGSCYLSYQHGQEIERGRVAEAQEKAVKEALEKYKAQAIKDRKAALAAETKRQEARLAQAVRRTRLEQNIQQNPRPSCDLDPIAWGLLNDAITASNRLTTTGTSSSPSTLSSNPPTD